MKIKKILYPTDFSNPSDAGLGVATSLARDNNATIVLLHVEEPPMAYGGGEMYYGIPEPDTRELEAMLEKVAPTDSTIKVERRLVIGDPATEIVRTAEAEGVDLIVMGTHGRTGLKRLLMGSVAEAVVRKAHCPVFSFKPQSPALVNT